MNGLESKESPFRTLHQFYDPITKQKDSSSKKIFRQKLMPAATIDQISPAKPLTVLTYLSQINRAKSLQKRFKFREDEGWSINQRRWQFGLKKVNNEKNDTHSRLETLFSSNPNNMSIFSIHRNKIISEKKMLSETIKQSQKHDELRFSFYNTVEKSDYLSKKFREDSSLTERGSNKFQNNMNRNIAQEKLLDLISSVKSKFKKGKI